MLGFLQGRDVFVQDVYGGADENYRLPVRIVTELAWHSMFVRNMFILPQTLEEYKRFVPEFTIIAMPSFKAMPAVDNTASETFICLSFEKKLAIIGNTAYVNMTGACNGCQMAAMTIAGIQQRLMEVLGEFIKVVPASEMSKLVNIEGAGHA